MFHDAVQDHPHGAGRLTCGCSRTMPLVHRRAAALLPQPHLRLSQRRPSRRADRSPPGAASIRLTSTRPRQPALPSPRRRLRAGRREATTSAGRRPCAWRRPPVATLFLARDGTRSPCAGRRPRAARAARITRLRRRISSRPGRPPRRQRDPAISTSARLAAPRGHSSSSALGIRQEYPHLVADEPAFWAARHGF